MFFNRRTLRTEATQKQGLIFRLPFALALAVARTHIRERVVDRLLLGFHLIKNIHIKKTCLTMWDFRWGGTSIWAPS